MHVRTGGTDTRTGMPAEHCLLLLYIFIAHRLEGKRARASVDGEGGMHRRAFLTSVPCAVRTVVLRGRGVKRSEIKAFYWRRSCWQC